MKQPLARVHPLKIWGGSGTPLVFAHANGFPPQAYRGLLEELQQVYQIAVIEHRPLWQPGPPPANLSWQQLVTDVIAQLEGSGLGPVVYVGHSLGAVLGLMAACQRPDLFQQLVMVEPVIFGHRQQWLMTHLPWRFKRRIKLIDKTLRRPRVFPSPEEAFSFHRRSRTLSVLSDDALWDYIQGGFDDLGDQLVMRFPPTWEAVIYGTIPYVWPAIKQVKVPVVAVRAANSNTLSAKMWKRWGRRRPDHQRLELAESDHLLPLAQPERVVRHLLPLLVGAKQAADSAGTQLD